MQETLLRVESVTKVFGPTVAVNNVSIQINRGDILGLIGENGSGKSTLSSVIAGIHQPSEGTLFLKNKPYHPTSMIDALNNGVGMIVQEAGTVSGISIAENLFLGREHLFGKLLINKKKMIKASNLILKDIGMGHIDASKSIMRINMQDRKLVELAKVMMEVPDILIIDETTTALSQQGRQIVYDIIKRQVSDNKSVIFISHDLDEVMHVCTRITVLRDGKKIIDLNRNEFNIDLIKKSMIGRELVGHYYPPFNRVIEKTELVLQAKSIHTISGLSNFSIQLRKGEILGIGGISHCGMHELGKALFGADTVLSGDVLVNQNNRIMNVEDAIKHGIGYVSKDRDLEALVLDASIKDNIAICGLDFMKTSQIGLISMKKENLYVSKQIQALSIKCTSEDQLIQSLSGGNKQKVVFGKWVGRNSDILILDCPTRGVDIGVKAAMYRLMHDMREAGKSIIMISEELPELIGMSNRIVIMKDMKISQEITDPNKMTEEYLIEFMI